MIASSLCFISCSERDDTNVFQSEEIEHLMSVKESLIDYLISSPGPVSKFNEKFPNSRNTVLHIAHEKPVWISEALLHERYIISLNSQVLINHEPAMLDEDLITLSISEIVEVTALGNGAYSIDHGESDELILDEKVLDDFMNSDGLSLPGKELLSNSPVEGIREYWNSRSVSGL
jgi:hypothetical protein